MRTAPKLFGIKGMHVYGVQKTAVDRRWTNKSPCTFRDLRRPRSLSSTKDKRAASCCANTTRATGATSSWDVANAHPEIFGELRPVVDFHFLLSFDEPMLGFLLEIELEDGTKLSTSLQHYGEQTSILDHPA